MSPTPSKVYKVFAILVSFSVAAVITDKPLVPTLLIAGDTFDFFFCKRRSKVPVSSTPLFLQVLATL